MEEYFVPLNLFHEITLSSVAENLRILNMRWKSDCQEFQVKGCDALFLRWGITQPFHSYIFWWVIVPRGRSIVLLVPWLVALAGIGAWGGYANGGICCGLVVASSAQKAYVGRKLWVTARRSLLSSSLSKAFMRVGVCINSRATNSLGGDACPDDAMCDYVGQCILGTGLRGVLCRDFSVGVAAVRWGLCCLPRGAT